MDWSTLLTIWYLAQMPWRDAVSLVVAMLLMVVTVVTAISLQWISFANDWCGLILGITVTVTLLTGFLATKFLLERYVPARRKHAM